MSSENMFEARSSIPPKVLLVRPRDSSRPSGSTSCWAAPEASAPRPCCISKLDPTGSKIRTLGLRDVDAEEGAAAAAVDGAALVEKVALRLAADRSEFCVLTTPLIERREGALKKPRQSKKQHAHQVRP